MSNLFPEVTAYEFYSEIFPPEKCERKGDPESHGSNPIITYMIDQEGNPAHLQPREEYRTKQLAKTEAKTEAKTGTTTGTGTETAGDKQQQRRRTYYRNEILFQDTYEESLKKTQGCTFALCGMCTYSGRRKSAKNAYRCHGFCIDLDGVGMRELSDFWGWVQNLEKIPVPTFVASSGHGLHVYYVFENPVPLYPAVASQLQRLKRGLTGWVWNRETSNYPVSQRQYQGIYQCFRMVGSNTKIGKGKSARRVRAWRTGKPVTLEYLNQFVGEQWQCSTSPDYSSWDWADGEHHSLAECRELYPEWYQRRIIEKQPGKQWVCDHALYDWWLSRIQEGDGARDGTRYHCISCLYVYAIKCGIAREFVDADAEALIPELDALTQREDNAFTKKDVEAAAAYYKPEFARMTRKEIARRTCIEIPSRRRNGRKQGEHLELARFALQLKYRNQEWPGGRPDKAAIVAAWRAGHPEGRKVDCVRDTGLSKPTVLKWWDAAVQSSAEDAAEDRKKKRKGANL